MKTLWSWLALRTKNSRADLRAALLGMVGGGSLAVALTLVQDRMDFPYDGESEGGAWAGVQQLWKEWRPWPRPGDDLDLSMDCPPGAYCCPHIPDHPCRDLLGGWAVSTPACPFESAPISELPWARGYFGEKQLDRTGQPMWLGCQLTEGKWHIVAIEVGPDGDALSGDDRVLECIGPETGWPMEFWTGWPELVADQR